MTLTAECGGFSPLFLSVTAALLVFRLEKNQLRGSLKAGETQKRKHKLRDCTGVNKIMLHFLNFEDFLAVTQVSV